MERPKLTKLKYSIDDIVAVTGESRNNVYHALKNGDLKSFVVGRRRCARPADVEAWVDYLQRESDAGRPVRYQARVSEAQ